MTKFTAAAASVALALVAGSAFAADLPSRKSAPVYVPPAPLFIWSGLYGGVNVGYGFGNGDQDVGGMSYITPALQTFPPGPGKAVLAFPGSSAFGGANNMTGIVGGGQVGYNWQFSPWLVIGLEADIQASDVHSTVNSAGLINDPNFGPHLQSATSTKSVDWYGTVRGRIGVTPFAPNWLIYGTGGFAYGQVNHGVGFGDNGAFLPNLGSVGTAQFDDTKTGWTAGGGIEWSPMAFPAWSLKVEYLYVDLGSTNISTTGTSGGNPVFGATYSSPTRFHTVRAGLNWHFNPFTPAPIVAKY